MSGSLIERLWALAKAKNDDYSVAGEAADEIGQLMYRLREVIKHHDNEREEANVEIARLRAENAELRADAERYRWLRNDNSPFSWQSRNRLSADQIDAAIDAARKEEK